MWETLKRTHTHLALATQSCMILRKQLLSHSLFPSFSSHSIRLNEWIMSFYQGANELLWIRMISSFPFDLKAERKNNRTPPPTPTPIQLRQIIGIILMELFIVEFGYITWLPSQSRSKMIDIVLKLNYANSVFQSPLRRLQKHIRSEISIANELVLSQWVCVCLSVSIFLWYHPFASRISKTISQYRCVSLHSSNFKSSICVDSWNWLQSPSAASKYLLFFHSFAFRIFPFS